MSEEWKGFVAVFVITAAGCFLFALGVRLAQSDFKHEAIKAGVAKWTVDSEGVVSFEFIKPAEAGK